MNGGRNEERPLSAIQMFRLDWIRTMEVRGQAENVIV